MKTFTLSILFRIIGGERVPITSGNWQQLQLEVFVFGAIIAVVFLLIAWLISNSIAFEEGKDAKDARKRRVAFIILGVIAIILLFFINSFVVTENLKGAQEKRFVQVNVIGIIIDALVYFVGGFITSKIFKNTKWGTIFPTRK